MYMYLYYFLNREGLFSPYKIDLTAAVSPGCVSSIQSRDNHRHGVRQDGRRLGEEPGTDQTPGSHRACHRGLDAALLSDCHSRHTIIETQDLNSYIDFYIEPDTLKSVQIILRVEIPISNKSV